MVRVVSKVFAVVAIVMVLVVFLAPAIDLPVTALRSLRFAQLALMLLALLARQLLVLGSGLRPHYVLVQADSLVAPNGPPLSLSPLRC